MDDIWDDDTGLSEAQYDKQVAERNWNRLQDTHGVAGYKEGITEGKQISLQKGFDRGYAAAAIIGLELGRLRGQLSTLIQLYTLSPKASASVSPAQLDQLKALHSELEGLGVERVFTRDFFRATERSQSEKGETNAAGGECTSGCGADGRCKSKNIKSHIEASVGESADSHPQKIVDEYRLKVHALLVELGWES